MRWYEYKMESDDLHAPDDLKAKLLAMADTLTDEEKAQPMMAAPQAAAPAAPAKNTKTKKFIHFPHRQVGVLAACLAVCVVGYGAFATGMLPGLGAKSSNFAAYSADSTAAAGVESRMMAAMDTAPETATYSLGAADYSADNGTAALSADEASAAVEKTHSAKIIYTANLTLESKDYEAARAALDSALQEAGGYLESSSEYSDADTSRSVSLTFRVPQENYESFLAAVAQAGNVTYKSQQADDVTAQYIDVETRLSNLQAEFDRLQELQAQADNLSDLLQIESSILDVQTQIESWQSQLDWYSNQVTECTVSVNLNEVQTYTPTSEGFGSRIGNAFAQGWSSFVSGLQQLAVALAGAWPVVVIVAAVAGGVILWRKKKH